MRYFSHSSEILGLQKLSKKLRQTNYKINMKKLLSFLVLLIFIGLSAGAKTDINKFEGKWVHKSNAGPGISNGPRTFYIWIADNDGAITIRFKQVNEKYGNIEEAVFYDNGEDVSFDGETLSCIIPNDHWGVKHSYKMTIADNTLRVWQTRSDNAGPLDETGFTTIFFNEKDNW